MKIIFFLYFFLFLTSLNSQVVIGGADIETLILDPSFYSELSNIVSFLDSGAIIIPYEPGFGDAVRLARRGSWTNIYLKINPMVFSWTSPENVAEDIYENLEVAGVTLNGLWIEVFNSNDYWMVSQKMNVALVLNMLQTFKNYWNKKGYEFYCGVYTTKANWNIVMGGTSIISDAGFYYYSAYSDSFKCKFEHFAGWNYCYLQQIMKNIKLGSYEYNFNLYDFIISS